MPISYQALTRNQVRRVDQLAIETLGFSGLVLMENAGANAARVILELLREKRGADLNHTRAVVVCGGGNNGGDGYVVARHLHNAGVEVAIYSITDPNQLPDGARANFHIARQMAMNMTPLVDEASLEVESESWKDADVLVDALLGTGFSGQVRLHMAKVIDACRSARKGQPSIVALDIPSGLDCDTGQPSDPTIEADVTVTFVAPKIGFSQPSAHDYLGLIEVVGIGAPDSLIDQVK